MALVNDRCICLRKVEYSETSQILTLLARQRGVVQVIAKGAHRVTRAGASRFGGGVDLMEVGAATFTDRVDKDLATLTEWTLLEGHRPLRADLRAMYLGLYACEVTAGFLAQRDPHPDLFDTLEWVLAELGTPRREQALLAFELELLRQTGFLPEFDRCVACRGAVGRVPRVGFDAAAGGLLCRGCEGAYPQRLTFDGRLVPLLQNLLRLGLSPAARGRLPGLTRHQTDPLNRLLAGYMQHVLGRELRLADWVCR